MNNGHTKCTYFFQTLENYKDLLINLPDETGFNTQNVQDNDSISVKSDNTQSSILSEIPHKNLDDFNDAISKWIKNNQCSTLHIVYENLPECFTNYLNNTNYTDYNTVLFERFLDVQPIITVEYFYICIGYIFNINYSIKSIFSNLLNHQQQ